MSAGACVCVCVRECACVCARAEGLGLRQGFDCLMPLGFPCRGVVVMCMCMCVRVCISVVGMCAYVHACGGTGGGNKGVEQYGHV